MTRRVRLARVNALLDQGADPNAQPGERASSPLLQTVNALFGRTSGTGESLVMVAIREDHWQVAEALVRHGADPNVRDGWGATALSVAALRGRVWLVRLLLDHGAAVRDTVNPTHTPLGAAAACADHTQATEIVRLLLDHGARPGDDPEALVQGIVQGNGPVAELLLSHGADPNGGQPRAGQTGIMDPPIVQAAHYDRTALCRLLLGRGADPTVTIQASPLADQTAAMVAHDPALRQLLRQAETDWRRRHPAAGVARR